MFHDSIDIELWDLLSGAIKEVDKIKRKRSSLNKEVNNMIDVIEISPELFHDGIDEEIISLLKKISKK